MDIKQLNQRPGIDENSKLKKAYFQFEHLLSELKKKNLSENVLTSINENIDAINAVSETGKELKLEITRRQAKILKLVEKEHKIVPINHYRNVWLAVGMAAFGIPLGVVFGTSLGNMAFIGLGIPIGLSIGMAVGAGMDKKALEEGRQLEIEIKA